MSLMREYWLKFKRFVLPYPLGFLGKYIMKMILKTCQIEVKGLEHLKKSEASKRILVVWHNQIAIICEFFHRFLPKEHYAAFLSKSRDGEPIAQVLKRYPGAKSIRVAHSMRHHALYKAVHFLNKESSILIMTPDGPKGPRYKVKPGVVYAAQESDAAIFAFSWTCSHFWEFNTWDQFRLPKPFSKLTIHISAPIQIDKQVDREEGIKLIENLLVEIPKSN